MALPFSIPNRLEMTAHDSWADIDNDFYKKVTALKAKGVKVSIALGGWNDSEGDKYSRMVSSPSSRRNFVAKAVQFIEKWGFEGLDLDWEYPKCWQVDCSAGPSTDKENFAALVSELRAAFDSHGHWDKKTGHVAPLYAHPDDEFYYFNANYTMHYWAEKGADKRKLMMGMPMYGQAFTLASAAANQGLNAPAP